jgi:hypothetical protein
VNTPQASQLTSSTVDIGHGTSQRYQDAVSLARALLMTLAVF